MEKRYEPPRVEDYGNLVEMTEANFLVGLEDGASKIEQDLHHSIPGVPGI